MPIIGHPCPGHWTLDPYRAPDAARRAESVFKRRLDSCVRDAFKVTYGAFYMRALKHAETWDPEQLRSYILGLWRARNGH